MKKRFAMKIPHSFKGWLAELNRISAVASVLPITCGMQGLAGGHEFIGMAYLFAGALWMLGTVVIGSRLR